MGDIFGVEVLVDMMINFVEGNESEFIVLGLFYCENLLVLFKGGLII